MANFKDPTDHFRTTLPHTGEHFIDIYSWPGIISIVLGALALIGGVAAAAYQRVDWVPTAGIVGRCLRDPRRHGMADPGAPSRDTDREPVVLRTP